MRSILKTISYMAVMVSAITMLSSCGDELPEPQVKPRTQVTIQTDWSACGLENTPNSYFMSVNDEVSTVSGNTQELTLKSDNDYTFLLYTGSSSITVSEGYATVERAKFQVDDANAINGNPDDFCFGSDTETSLMGDAAIYQIPMKRLTRKVNVALILASAFKDADGDEISVQGGYAILTNVYSAYNLTAGVATTPVSAVSEVSVNAEGNSVVAPFNLLGIDLGTAVNITYVLSMSDGTSRIYTADVTSQLTDVNDGNLSDLAVNVETQGGSETPDEPEFEFPYENVYMFGDATPGGWSMGEAPVKLTKVNSHTFTTEITLIEGEFKFPLNNDWGCDWIMATESDAPITSTACQIVKNEPGFDYKWKVSASEAGRYKIVVDVKAMTMTATKL